MNPNQRFVILVGLRALRGILAYAQTVIDDMLTQMDGAQVYDAPPKRTEIETAEVAKARVI